MVTFSLPTGSGEVKVSLKPPSTCPTETPGFLFAQAGVLGFASALNTKFCGGNSARFPNSFSAPDADIENLIRSLEKKGEK